jgi:hypothetical protein
LGSRIKNNRGNFKACIKKDTVKQFTLNIDDNLSSNVTLLKTPDGGKCYVVGTAHFSIESQNEVAKVYEI